MSKLYLVVINGCKAKWVRANNDEHAAFLCRSYGTSFDVTPASEIAWYLVGIAAFCGVCDYGVATL